MEVHQVRRGRGESRWINMSFAKAMLGRVGSKGALDCHLLFMFKDDSMWFVVASSGSGKKARNAEAGMYCEYNGSNLDSQALTSVFTMQTGHEPETHKVFLALRRHKVCARTFWTLWP